MNNSKLVLINLLIFNTGFLEVNSLLLGKDKSKTI